MPKYRKKGGVQFNPQSVLASSVSGRLRLEGIVFTIHGIDVYIEELTKLFELSIDKEKFESMIVALRITKKDDVDDT